MKRLTHDEYFMELAKTVALRSPCLNRQVGCVLVDSSNHILSTGYNGPPSKIEHCIMCKRKGTDEGENLHLCQSVHAETNALLQCPDVRKIETCYVTINPCEICLRMLANTATKRIVFETLYSASSIKYVKLFWVKRLGRQLAIVLTRRKTN